MLGPIYVLQFTQMEDINTQWCHVSVWNISLLPPPACGSEGAMKKRLKDISSCLCLISALTEFGPMLLQFIYFLWKHMFQSTSEAGFP